MNIVINVVINITINIIYNKYKEGKCFIEVFKTEIQQSILLLLKLLS